MPKIVLAGTTIAVMMSVTRSAWMNAGLVSSSQTAARPSSNIR